MYASVFVLRHGGRRKNAPLHPNFADLTVRCCKEALSGKHFLVLGARSLLTGSQGTVMLFSDGFITGFCCGSYIGRRSNDIAKGSIVWEMQ